MRTTAILACLLMLSAAGCGYHTAGSATHLPPDIGTIDVPIFQTKVENYHTEVAFTDAVDRMHAIGKWPNLSAAVADQRAEAVCRAVEEGRRDRRGSDGQYAAVLRRGGGARNPCRGGQPKPARKPAFNTDDIT